MKQLATKEELKNILKEEENLIFYKIMKYPIPKNKEAFWFEKEWKESIKDNKWFSRDKKDPLLDEYITQIDKYGWLYKSIPFIRNIYLCNSITFNSLHDWSDIDLFIVTKKGSLRRARFFSVLMFTLLGLKRGGNKKNKKYCLSFYVTEDGQNLYNIMLPKTDIYLTYWLGHLVPLYNESENNIYKENKRFDILLPNHPKKYTINIWNKIWDWKTKFKKITEFIFGWIIGKTLELTIKLLRLPIVIIKTKQHWGKWRWIIINRKMLKFHMDIRRKIHLLHKTHSSKTPRK